MHRVEENVLTLLFKQREDTDTVSHKMLVTLFLSVVPINQITTVNSRLL